MPALFFSLRFLVILVFAASLTGCVTRGYKLAPKETPPAVAINFTNVAPPSSNEAAPPAAAPAAEVLLHTVIIYQGPGSWKNEAYWDEYVVTVKNPGDTPLVVGGATLHANNGESTGPGNNPWTLERAGKAWWQTNAARQTGVYLSLGAGTLAGAGIATAAALSGGLWGPITGAAAAGVGVGAAIIVAMPLMAIGTVGMNIHRKHQVQDEFVRRRLVLPATIPPGGTLQGSLFFRITPSPRELELQMVQAEAPTKVSVSLAPLSSLHMKFPMVPAVPR